MLPRGSLNQVCLNPLKPQCHQEGHWHINNSIDFVAWGFQAQIALQQSSMVWSWMTEGPVFPWPDHCHLQQGASGSHHSVIMIHLLSSGHNFFSLYGVWGTHCYFSFLYWKSKIKQSYQPYQTHHLPAFLGVFITHFFLMVPISPISLLGSDLIMKVGAFISFAHPYPLDPIFISHFLPSPKHTMWHTFSFTRFPCVSQGIGYPKPLYRQASSLFHHSTTKPHQKYHQDSIHTVSPKSQGI